MKSSCNLGTNLGKGGLVRLATKPHRDVGAGQECKIHIPYDATIR